MIFFFLNDSYDSEQNNLYLTIIVKLLNDNL